MSGERAARIIDLDIEALDAGGDGIASVGHRRLSIPFTIPGERVRVRLDRRGRDRTVPTLVEIVRPSPHRVRPRCAHFGGQTTGAACGGCTWQHISYPEQLRLKRALLDRLVGEAVPGAPPARPPLAVSSEAPWGFRNTVHFAFARRPGGGTGRSLVMGHYARGSRRVIPVRECPVHDERGNAFAFLARDRFAAAGIEPAGAGGVLRGLAVRVGSRTPEMMATFLVTGDADRRLRAATRDLLAKSPPTSAHLNLHDRDDGLVFGERTRRLHGQERMREEIAGVSLLMSPTAFFQTHVRAAEILVGLVLDAVPPGAEVIDLYAGGGLFAIPLARAGHVVVAVEENPAAVADGEAALRLNPGTRDRCRFIARRAETAAPALKGTDLVVLDPPRDGCSISVLRAVFERLRPPRAVYVSCSPESLAADLKTICGRGYRIRSLQPVDMFPHTAHVETVATLDRG